MSSLAEVLDAHERRIRADLHTSLPASVVSYDPLTNIAMAQPMVQAGFFDVDGAREFETLPVIGVPIVWPRFGGKVVRGKLESGDGLLLVFSEASLAEWRATGQISAPTDARRQSIGYAFGIPGAFPDVQPMSPADAIEVAAGAMIVGADGDAGQLIFGGTIPGVRFGKTAISPVALAVPTDAGIAGVIVAINALIAVIAALIASLTPHTHATTAPGAPTGPMIPAAPMPAAPTPMVSAPTTASLLVKSM